MDIAVGLLAVVGAATLALLVAAAWFGRHRHKWQVAMGVDRQRWSGGDRVLSDEMTAFLVCKCGRGKVVCKYQLPLYGNPRSTRAVDQISEMAPRASAEFRRALAKIRQPLSDAEDDDEGDD